ncbi:hypothetical protein LOTGIDRAFT_121872, partial [Lottia gigantea]
RYEEVGQLEPIKEEGKAYEVGQLFLHKVLGYRGIVLNPWRVTVYDHDKVTKREENQDEKTTSDSSQVTGKKQTYYEVLMDERDYPYIRIRAESVTFIEQVEYPFKLCFSGLDYVAHDDIIPYHSKEKTPIVNQCFNKFLLYDPESSPPFVMTEMLRTWHDKNITELQLSEVRRETTENIRVTVIPFYLGKKVIILFSFHCYFLFQWRYCVRLENLGEETVQLRERAWKIMSLTGSIDRVTGRGVLGEQPILSGEDPTYKAYQYSSHVVLHAGSGYMWGSYRMERRDGTSFNCKIPKFYLESKHKSENGYLGS